MERRQFLKLICFGAAGVAGISSGMVNAVDYPKPDVKPVIKKQPKSMMGDFDGDVLTYTHLGSKVHLNRNPSLNYELPNHVVKTQKIKSFKG